MKSQYTLIAFDMDGTLLDPAKEILPQTREAVRRWLRSGRIWMPGTWRECGTPFSAAAL